MLHKNKKLSKKQLKAFFDLFAPYGYDYTSDTKSQMLKEFQYMRDTISDNREQAIFNECLTMAIKI